MGEKKIYLCNAFSLNMLENVSEDFDLSVSRRSDEEIKKYIDTLIKEHGYELVSAIGHPATAKLVSEILERPVAPNRVEVKTDLADDVIVVFQLKKRLPYGKELTVDELKEMEHEWYVIYIIY